MKRTIAFVILAAALCLALVGCKREKPIVFTAVVEEVTENAILVRTADDVGFDLASVSFDTEMEDPGFAFAIGQTLKLTIFPEVRESYPVQVTAIAVELVYDSGAPIPADLG